VSSDGIILISRSMNFGGSRAVRRHIERAWSSLIRTSCLLWKTNTLQGKKKRNEKLIVTGRRNKVQFSRNMKAAFLRWKWHCNTLPNLWWVVMLVIIRILPLSFRRLLHPHGLKLHFGLGLLLSGTGRHFHRLAWGPFVSLMYPSELR